MAAQLPNPDSDDMAESHDINVTPFIDVVLVLLIIFMVAAPLSTVDVAVDLPSTQAQPQERPDEPLYLTLTETLDLRLGNEQVERGQLTDTLNTASGGDKGQRIYLRADRSVDYGELMDLMNLLRSAGYLKIALVGQETSG
ncbi:TonB system transport protein ExbD [Marinimicrobium alkaliphilum]|uniref:TonB system transport protein ExbD n=1 Tax=Marinimicrobium alkaliphilum TaxID=2202654 RepID=UPI000DB96F7D|nr:TonB system transport protein ExbD [Marinimicrobium alkaliphilum]